MSDKEFTPALGFQAITPLYDLAVGLLTREDAWRAELVRLVAPQPNQSILDVGCGTGSLMARIGLHEPRARLIGLDPDPNVLAIARRKLDKLGLTASWRQGFLDDQAVAAIGRVTKVVSSLVFHQTSVDEKRRILTNMRRILGDGGALYIADYGEQRTNSMRVLFRLTVQMLDGVSDTQPNADGCLPKLIRAAGFGDVKEHRVILTATGSISLYEAISG